MDAGSIPVSRDAFTQFPGSLLISPGGIVEKFPARVERRPFTRRDDVRTVKLGKLYDAKREEDRRGAAASLRNSNHPEGTNAVEIRRISEFGVECEVSGENVSAGTGPRGSNRGEAADLGTHTENNDGATLAANTAVDARGGSPQGAHLSGAATPRPPRGRRRQNQNGLDTTQLQAENDVDERLKQFFSFKDALFLYCGLQHSNIKHSGNKDMRSRLKKGNPIALQVKTERLTPDNNSTSSRSVTPSSSSHPGTPPNATPLGGPEGPPPPHHLKHMEQMMGRNYSDFMRSLAAKYNNANPNDYFSTPRNGYPPGLDPRFPAFKAAATPFVGLMAPLGAPQPSAVPTTSPLSNKDPKEQKQDSLFGNPVFPPMIDMSSTQALLHMVRTANAAQSAAELETYLKGKYHKKLHTFPYEQEMIDINDIIIMEKRNHNYLLLANCANKRDAGVTSPLDLSSPGGFAPRKRQRPETRRSESVSPKPKPTARPTTPPPVRCPTLYGHIPCGDGQAVNRWTIEDVVNYVSSIDICAEYAQITRHAYLARTRYDLPLRGSERCHGAELSNTAPLLTGFVTEVIPPAVTSFTHT
ncbi:Uncharacterized protein DBV15_11990 [Temnothorax longispinosus]|uniref:Uncharacterized protein n=1 Tax=Temnothorax longispinosus TaxID=300112 RepID=A0A4S2KLB3_9HYME|nr:Uncharacterized protein DBV15_11990 [Temnothorax longispinosus]